METLLKEIEDAGESAGRGLAITVQSLVASRPLRELLTRVLGAYTTEVYESSAYLRDRKSLREAEPIITAIVDAGFPVDKIRSKDFPDQKMRSFHFETAPALDGSWYGATTFDLRVYLAQDSECELIEVKREAQPDKITYAMKCKDDLPITTIVEESFDAIQPDAGDSTDES